MRPRKWPTSTRRPRSPPGGFNGAAALRPRKCVPSLGASTIGNSLQWGRGLAAAEMAVDSYTLATISELQWGRGLAAAEMTHSSVITCSGRSLQWGRGLAAAEMIVAGESASSPTIASMGPRPCGRGNVGSRGWPSNCVLSFNGAAALRPRKWPASYRRVDRPRSFNGAAALRPRKSLAGPVGIALAATASMGPRPCGRGNDVWIGPNPRAIIGFNGAAALRPRKS